MLLPPQRRLRRLCIRHRRRLRIRQPPLQLRQLPAQLCASVCRAAASRPALPSSSARAAAAEGRAAAEGASSASTAAARRAPCALARTAATTCGSFCSALKSPSGDSDDAGVSVASSKRTHTTPLSIMGGSRGRARSARGFPHARSSKPGASSCG